MAYRPQAFDTSMYCTMIYGFISVQCLFTIVILVVLCYLFFRQSDISTNRGNFLLIKLLQDRLVCYYIYMYLSGALFNYYIYLPWPYL